MMCDITDQFRKIDKEATRENLEHQTRERGFFKASEFTHGDVMYSFGLCKDIHDEDESEIDHLGHNHDNEWDFQNLLTFPVDSSFLKFWNFFISILCLYSSYLYGWIAAFSEYYPEPLPLVYAMEALFLVSIGINFLKQFIPEGEILPVKSFSRISKHYIKNGTFVEDIVVIFPIQFIMHEWLHHNYWYLIKIYRV